MRIVIFGASGATGRLAAAELVRRGNEVTAFVRNSETLPDVRTHRGDVMNLQDVQRAVQGQDAVLVVLGIRENPVSVRLRGSRSTPMNVRSEGTRNVIAAMQEHGVRRLVVQTTFGAAESRGRLSLKWKLIFSLLLKPQIDDTEEQERIVRASGLDWVIVRPVGLHDGRDGSPLLVSTKGKTRGMSVSRQSVARVLADESETSLGPHRVLAVSA
jgi:uncharacterized protein YbjT (DUF2867 family)